MKIFADQDTIVRLPSDPKALEAYFKTLPPEVIEGFAQNALREGERPELSEMAKTIRETILRLASTNKCGPTSAPLD
jgi:hypothetical protein